jgi:hypothetical protein
MKRLLIVIFAAVALGYAPQAHAKDAISSDQARTIAQSKIDEIYPGGDATYLPDKIDERKFGWIFHIVFRKYVETQSLDYILYGAPSLLIERDGSVDEIPGSVVFQNREDAYLKEHIPRLFNEKQSNPLSN